LRELSWVKRYPLKAEKVMAAMMKMKKIDIQVLKDAAA